MMGKIVGLGGVFINLKGDKDKLYHWYEDVLGLDMSEYGTGFIEGEQLMIISLKRDYSDKGPFLNFRVDDIESLVNHLKKHHIQFLTDIESFDYGKFVRFVDPFDNQIELWEPLVENYKKMVKQEIKTYRDKKTVL